LRCRILTTFRFTLHLFIFLFKGFNFLFPVLGWRDILLLMVSTVAFGICFCNYLVPGLVGLFRWLRKKYKNRSCCLHRPCRHIVCCQVYEDRETADEARARASGGMSPRATLERQNWVQSQQACGRLEAPSNLWKVIPTMVPGIS
jgi:hypothetical protein